MSSQPRRPPSLGEQRDQEREAATDKGAVQRAVQEGPIPNHGDGNVWEILGDPDITRGEDDELGQLLATELSDKFVFTQIRSWEDWEDMSWYIDNEFDRIRYEYPEENSLCVGENRSIMYGEMDETGAPAPNPPLDDEMNRRIRSAGNAKKRMAALGVGAKGLNSLTQIIMQNLTTSNSNDSPGILGRAREVLVG